MRFPDGGTDWPSSFLPQQATELSALTPQLWYTPALADVNSPVGGVDWPCGIHCAIESRRHERTCEGQEQRKRTYG